MSAASVLSGSGTVATYTRKMGQTARPEMEIFLDNHTSNTIYTTLDALSGRVEISAPHSARFDEVRITLEGTVKTYVEAMSPATNVSRVTATHNFLRLNMPIRESDYPQPRIAEAGRKYKFPFNFVIPAQLLPRACTHRCDSDHVHQAHLQLPPSMGEREVSLLDDLAPEMSKVQYVVRVRVIRHGDGGTSTVVEAKKKLHVVPAVGEAPPMSLGAGDEEYTLSKTKSLKKGVFSGKLGRITASTLQTAAIMLPPPSSESRTPAATMATVNLRFDPSDATSQPPRLGGLTTKIRVSNFFAAKPAETFLTNKKVPTTFETTRSVYETCVPLSSRCVEAVSWEKHDPKATPERRNSDSSTSSSDCSDSALSPDKKQNGDYYTASILVPISLPSSKAWIPTFHSCIVSRTYTLELSLSVHTPGTGVPASTVTLRVPLQIAAQGHRTQLEPLTPAEAAAELADAEEYLRPRVIEVPNNSLVGNSVLVPPPVSDLPPSYEANVQAPAVRC